MSLNFKHREYSPPSLSPKRKVTKIKTKMSNLQELLLFDDSPRKSVMKDEVKVSMLSRVRKPLPLIKSLRIKTEGDELVTSNI